MSSSRLLADLNRPLDELIEEHKSEKLTTRKKPFHRTDGSSDRRRERIHTSYNRRQEHEPSPRGNFHLHPIRKHHPNNRRHQSTRPSQPQSAIRITNLHYEVSEKDLKELFESIGPVHQVVVDYDRAGRSNGSATVHFYDRDDAYRARERFENVPLDGKAMQITIMRFHTQSERIRSKDRTSMELDADMDRYMMSAQNHPHFHPRCNPNNSNRMQID